MRYISLDEVLALHEMVAAQSGGGTGVRDYSGLESAIAQPSMSFDGQDLYPTLAEKAGALSFSLIMNHPFIDGNKRIGHAALEVFVVLNGFELDAATDEQERIILSVASGQTARDEFVHWIRSHLRISETN